MNQITQTDPAPKKQGTLLTKIAHKYDVDPEKMLTTLKRTAFSQGKNQPEITNEQMMALLIVADQYNLNPFTKEIYAFAKAGNITPIVSIDGWLKLINSDPNFDGMEFVDHREDGKVTAITCKMFRKDRSHPTEVTEYMSECKRTGKGSEVWDKWSIRMLRHKATIQAARYAFSFAGIYDPDEGERIAEEPAEPVAQEPNYTDAEKIEFDRLMNLDPEDPLAFWLFHQSISGAARIGLYNSFQRPNIQKNKKIVNYLYDAGEEIFNDSVHAIKTLIDMDDPHGVAEIKGELREIGWELLLDHMNEDEAAYIRNLNFENLNGLEEES